MNERPDLLIRAGRVVCPATGRDGPGAVAVHRGLISGTGELPGPAGTTLDRPDAILLPGLIDLHGHPSRSGSKYGIDPDEAFFDRGTTTVLAQGEAGAAGYEAYRRETIDRSKTRVRLALHLAATGEDGPGPCFGRLENADVEACVAAIERADERIWGISVNVSHQSCGPTDAREILRRGLEAAGRTSRPLLVGLRRPEDWPLAEQLARLRPGDVVTYLYRRSPHCLLEGTRVMRCFREARERGIHFDVGHGRGSFDFGVAEAALRDGFPPDTISTDLQRGHAGQAPVHDLPRVMSKLRAAGMSEAAVFAAVTSTPAKILGLPEGAGSLRLGAPADLTLLHWEPRASLEDTSGSTRVGGLWEPRATIRAGTWISPA